MSYRLLVLSHLPIAYWRLEETSGTTAADIAGFGYNGTHTAPPVLGQPGLVAGSRGAVFDTTDRFTATVPDVLITGRELDPFAFECWVKVAAPPTARRRVMGRTNGGIVITPGGVEFLIPSSDGNTYTAYYTVMDWNEPLHIVGNYVGRNISLIVNAQEGIGADFKGEFTNTSTNLFVGGDSVSSSTTFTVDEVAVYKRTIDIVTASRHFDYGRSAMSPLDIAQNAGGTYYSMDDDSLPVAWTYTEDGDEDWATGTTDTLTVYNDRLIANGVDGIHTSDIYFLDNLTAIGGSRIDWRASSLVSVDISLDMGTTWTACTNHSEIPGMGAGADLTNKFIMVRKNFTNVAAAGYTPFLEDLKIVVYTDKRASSNLGTEVTISGSPIYAEKAYSPVEHHSDMGVKLAKGSWVSIPPSEAPAQTIEMWIRRDATNTGTANELIFDGRATGVAGPYLGVTTANATTRAGITTGYVNGVAQTIVISNLPIGVWTHVVFNPTVPQATPLFLNSSYTMTEASSGNNSFAHVAYYPTVLTAAQVLARYNMALGQRILSVVNTPNPTISEIATVNVPATSTTPGVHTGIKLYSPAWTTGSGGAR